MLYKYTHKSYHYIEQNNTQSIHRLILYKISEFHDTLYAGSRYTPLI